jgi:[protein-PII] uridylyltransferase
MWDIGLRASPTTRTVKECSRFDPDNLEFTLSTFDHRFLAGNFPLYQKLHNETFPGLVLSEWNTIAQKLGELARARHARYGNTIFHLEPNIKECPGGLRDFNLAPWFALLFHLKETKEWPKAAQRAGAVSIGWQSPAETPKPPSTSSPPPAVSSTSATAATTTPSTGNPRTKPPPLHRP